MARAAAVVLAMLVLASPGATSALAQANAAPSTTPAPGRPTSAHLPARPPIVLVVPRRGADAWTPVVRYAPALRRYAAPTIGRPPALGPTNVALARPAPRLDHRGPRTLSFFNVHTRESITSTYARNGSHVPAELTRLNRFLRDSRDESRVAIDPALLDILWEVRHRLGSTASYHVMSGYRSPATNAWLASVSSGVAANSLHMRGQAIDVMLPGRTAAQIRSAGHEVNRGGVGYYPTSGYVHLDSGPVRSW